MNVLDNGRVELAMTQAELWIRYFELGGMSTAFELEAFLSGVLEPTDHDHDVIAHTLNERFTELGLNHPIPYFSDDHKTDGA